MASSSGTWLITGGAGFIGSWFLKKALELQGAPGGPAELVVLDTLTYAGDLERMHVLAQDRAFRFVHGDICDAERVQGIFKEHDIARVIHFAAESHVDRSILGAREFLRTNVEGTYVLLEAARAAWGNGEGRLFVHVSTDEVYGDLEPEDEPFREDSRYRPSSPYSATKAASDHLARAWHRTYGLPVVVTNCTNNYGPWQYPEKLIPLMILNALDGQRLPVYGDGQQVRDWIHVEDHCDALALIAQKGEAGQTYLVGARNERTNLDIIRMICRSVARETGVSEDRVTGLMESVKDRPGHDRRYAAIPDRVERLGWKPRRVFETELGALVRWYREHREWARGIRQSDRYQSYYARQYSLRVPS